MRSGSGLHLHFNAVFGPGHCAQQRHGLDTRPGQLDTLPIVSRCFWGGDMGRCNILLSGFLVVLMSPSF